MFNSKRSIWITFRKEGVHSYPNAPVGVEFLKYPHRHIFYFKIEISVLHEDREIEFILFKREMENLYSGGILELNNKSCEMIADDIINYLNEKYPGREGYVEVSEDGENGARVNWFSIQTRAFIDNSEQAYRSDSTCC